MTVRVHIASTVDLERLEEFRTFLVDNLPNVRSFDGCLRVSVLLDEASGAMVLDEEWLSIEQHQAYLASIEESGVLGQLASFLTAPPDIRYYERELV